MQHIQLSDRSYNAPHFLNEQTVSRMSSSDAFLSRLSYAKQHIDPVTGLAVTAPGKSAAGDKKRKVERGTVDAIRKRRKEVEPVPQPAPATVGKVKDPNAAANNSRAGQNVPPFVPVLEEDSNQKMLGGVRTRDGGDNNSLLVLGGFALASWVFVQLRYGK